MMTDAQSATKLLPGNETAESTGKQYFKYVSNPLSQPNYIMHVHTYPLCVSTKSQCATY